MLSQVLTALYSFCSPLYIKYIFFASQQAYFVIIVFHIFFLVLLIKFVWMFFHITLKKVVFLLVLYPFLLSLLYIFLIIKYIFRYPCFCYVSFIKACYNLLYLFSFVSVMIRGYVRIITQPLSVAFFRRL